MREEFVALKLGRGDMRVGEPWSLWMLMSGDGVFEPRVGTRGTGSGSMEGMGRRLVWAGVVWRSIDCIC
jgi:hypothetical protein